TALYAARAGLSVEVREPRMAPVDKACGEGLMPSAVADLAELGVRPAGHPLAGIRYVGSGRSVDAPFRRGDGLGGRRAALHAARAEAVEGAGVEGVPRGVEDVAGVDGHVRVDAPTARSLVAADGLHSRVRRQLGAERPATHHRRFGLRAHASVAPWTPF